MSATRLLSTEDKLNSEGARSEFFFWGGVASRVPWRWRDSYAKTGNFGRVGDKNMLKMYKKAGVGRVTFDNIFKSS